MSETIRNGEIKLCCQEDAVKETFQLRAIDVSQLVARDDFNGRQQIGGVVCRIGDSGFHLSASDTDLVNQLTMVCNKGVIRPTPQHIDRAAFVIHIDVCDSGNVGGTLNA